MVGGEEAVAGGARARPGVVEPGEPLAVEAGGPARPGQAHQHAVVPDRQRHEDEDGQRQPGGTDGVADQAQPRDERPQPGHGQPQVPGEDVPPLLDRHDRLPVAQADGVLLGGGPDGAGTAPR